MTLKICHISDTHLRPFTVEPADILVHSGDALNYGTLEELAKFRLQLEEVKQDFKHIVLTPGNHDWYFQNNPESSISFLKETIPNIQVLIHNEATIEGLKFFGCSYQPFFCNWAFNIENPDDLLHKYSQIPDDTNILITHCPPSSKLDYCINRWNPTGQNLGSAELAYHLPRLKHLKVHMFGHIHYAYGIKHENGVQYSNAALCNENYDSVNKANIIEL